MSNEDITSGKNYRNVRSVLHLGMGGIYLLFGAIIAMYKNFVTVELEPMMAYAVGGLMMLYGAFRLVRGFMGIREMSRERRERK